MDSRDAQREAFGSFLDIVPVIDRLMADTAAPRAPADLLDLVVPLGLGRHSIVLDAGSYDGAWARRLHDRFGCAVVAVDIVPSAVLSAHGHGTPGVVGDVQELSFRPGAVDVVWCRDLLSCVPDHRATLDQFWQVLRPGGSVVIYAAFPTDDLEPVERARLFAALDAPAWWGDGWAAVDEAVRVTGFEVSHLETVSPEHQERNLLDGGDLARELAVLGRLHRHRSRFEAEMGPVWYERWRAWMAWAPYLLLGKLQTVVWVLRKPAVGPQHAGSPKREDPPCPSS